jgi:hypothetical protein
MFTFQAEESVIDRAPDIADSWCQSLKHALDNGWDVVQLVWLTVNHEQRTVRIIEDAIPLLGSRGTYEILYTTEDSEHPLQEYFVLDTQKVRYSYAASIFSSDPEKSYLDTGCLFAPHDVDEREKILLKVNKWYAQFTPLFSFFQHMQKEKGIVDGAQIWDEIVTDVETQDGDLRLVMMGFGGNTVPDKQYSAQLEPVKARGDKEAELVEKATALRQKRIAAFKSQVGKYRFRQIMPSESGDWYVEQGYPSSEAWACHLKGAVATSEQQLAHLERIEELLEKSEGRYEIGLLKGNTRGYDKVFWEVKGHTLLMEILVSGEINLRIDEPLVAQAYINEFDRLWESDSVDKGDYVRSWLGYCKSKATRRAATTAS